MPDASVELGLNAQPMYNELANAENKFTGGMNRMGQGVGRLVNQHENLLSSNHRVARQIASFSKDLASGASAADLFASGLEGIAKSLHLTIGSLAAIEVAAIGVQQIAKVREEVKGLQKELSELGRSAAGPAEFQTLETLQSNLEKVSATIKKINDLQVNEGHNGVWKAVRDFFRGGDADIGNNPVSFERRRQSIEKAEAERIETRDMKAIAQKKSDQLDIEGSHEPDFIKRARKVQADYQEKIGETGTPGSPHENQYLSMQIRRELEQALLGIADSIATKRRERVQLTLEDIAKNGIGFAEGGTIQGDHYKRTAQEALKLQDQAKFWSQLGYVDQAQVIQNRADDLKNSIPTLKDSEKDMKGEFKGALDEAQVLQDIKANTAKPIVNQ